MLKLIYVYLCVKFDWLLTFNTRNLKLKKKQS